MPIFIGLLALSPTVSRSRMPASQAAGLHPGIWYFRPVDGGTRSAAASRTAGCPLRSRRQQCREYAFHADTRPPPECRCRPCPGFRHHVLPPALLPPLRSIPGASSLLLDARSAGARPVEGQSEQCTMGRAILYSARPLASRRAAAHSAVQFQWREPPVGVRRRQTPDPVEPPSGATRSAPVEQSRRPANAAGPDREPAP